MQPSNYSPGELPQPQDTYTPPTHDQAGAGGELSNEQQQGQAIEQASAMPAAPQMPTQAPAQPAPLAPLPPANDPVASPQATASPHSPQIADDGDLIEKEWVSKAKHIVAQTKHDPYLQTKELNKMKADYLKKRYAKDLKLPEN